MATILIPKGFDLIIRNVQLIWGKFYANNNKDNEIPAGAIGGKIVKSGDTYIVYTCGRENTWSGPEGSFDIYDNNKNLQLGNYYWYCPHWSSENTSQWKQNPDQTVTNNYNIIQSGGNLNSGALGKITFNLIYSD